MQAPLLYRQLLEQFRQWIEPKDKRHLQGFSEIVAAMQAIWKRLYESLAPLSEPSGLSGTQPHGAIKLLCAQPWD